MNHEISIPGARRPIEDQRPIQSNDRRIYHLTNFFEEDTRWYSLPQYFKMSVLQTAIEIYTLNQHQVVQKAKEIDQKIPESPYLHTMAEKYGTLMEHHDILYDIFNNSVSSDDQDFTRIPARITQIRLADRAMGRKLEEEFGWDGANGFGEYANHAQIAINLCSDSIRTTIPPNL